MAFMKGEPLVAKLATVSMKYVFPATMVAAFIYSFTDNSSKKDRQPSK